MQTITPVDVFGNYKGLASIVEYTNDDGGNVETCCAQAAAATMIGFIDQDQPPPIDMVHFLEEQFPPNVMFGRWGTSPAQVVRMLDAHGLKATGVLGIDGLMSSLSAGRPVLMLLGVPTEFLHLSFREPHWVVAWGMDDKDFYLTNYGKMTHRELFAFAWGDFLVRAVGMGMYGFVCERK